jgi:ferredoxin
MIMDFLLVLLIGVAAIALLTLCLYLAQALVVDAQAASPASGVGATRTGASGTKDSILRARIGCAFAPPVAAFKTSGFTECWMCETAFGGTVTCASGCLGAGSCARVCPNDAIRVQGGRIVVLPVCSGCGRCVAVCPRKLIRLLPLDSAPALPCAAAQAGHMVSDCPISAESGMVNSRDFLLSGFQKLLTWGILDHKTRSR